VSVSRRHYKPAHILITGASSGIGASLAIELAGPGVTVSICGRSPSALDQTAQVCKQRGANVQTAELDVTNRLELDSWIRTIDAVEPIDLVIASAGIISGRSPDGRPETLDEATNLIQTNVIGMMNTVFPALELMSARGKGQIALLGSMSSYRGLSAFPSYSASKAANRAYGEALRSAYRTAGVAISVISPGFVSSKMEAQIVGPKVMLVSPEKAAKIIVRGLARNRAHIDFPILLRFGLGALALMPHDFGDLFVRPQRYSVRPRDQEKPR